MQVPEHARGHLQALSVHTLPVHIFCFHMALVNLILFFFLNLAAYKGAK